jgi:hypothetical protein
MNRRQFSAAALGLCLPGLAPAAPSEADAASGVRAALERGALAAVALLGRPDGFLGNPQVRITLPGALNDASRLLRAAGQGKRLDELITAMNRAAEAAVPAARQLFVDTVRSLSVEDALQLVRNRSSTAVTEFFAAKTRAPLSDRFLPIVAKATEKVELAERYNRVAGRAASMGLVRADQADVQQHVTTKTLDGLFFMIGEEEKKIRADPLKTGSAILRRVFGG